MRARVTGFEISTDQTRLDLDVIHRHLASSYWASGRTREVIERSIRHSLCFGAYADGGQVAFARVVTDRAVFGYLADVFVVPEYRGRGISKILVGHIVEHPDLAGLSVFMLRTRDAHALYARFGFEPLRHPEEVMGK
jgi:GNAT superfamily N-acetyltransferase